MVLWRKTCSVYLTLYTHLLLFTITGFDLFSHLCPFKIFKICSFFWVNQNNILMLSLLYKVASNNYSLMPFPLHWELKLWTNLWPITSGQISQYHSVSLSNSLHRTSNRIWLLSSNCSCHPQREAYFGQVPHSISNLVIYSVGDPVAPCCLILWQSKCDEKEIVRGGKNPINLDFRVLAWK